MESVVVSVKHPGDQASVTRFDEKREKENDSAVAPDSSSRKRRYSSDEEIREDK